MRKAIQKVEERIIKIYIGMQYGQQYYHMLSTINKDFDGAELRIY